MPAQLLDIPFVGGIDQSVAPQALPMTKSLSVQNGRFDKTGRITKRPGSTGNLASLNGLPASDSRLLSFRNELAIANSGQLQSFVPAAGNLIDKGTLPEATVRRSSFTHSAIGVYNADCAYFTADGGYLVTVWDNGANEILCTIVDVAGGAEVLSASPIVSSNCAGPRICVVSHLGSVAAYVLYNTTNATGIRVVKVTQGAFGTWTISAPITPTSGAVDASAYEIAAMSDRFVVAYGVGASSPAITLKSYDMSMSLLATGTNSSGVSTQCRYFGLRATTGERVWLAYQTFATPNNKVYLEWFDPATLVSGGAATLVASVTSHDFQSAIGVERIDPTTVAVVYTISVNGRSVGSYTYDGSVVCCDVYNNSGTHVISARETGASRLASKPFAVTDGFGTTRVYVWAYVGGACLLLSSMAQSQFSLVLLDLQLDKTSGSRPARPVAVTAPRFASPLDPTARFSFPPVSVPRLPDGALGAKATTVARILKSAGGRTGFARLDVDFGDTQRFAGAELGDSLHLSGGVPGVYSGGSLHELGFVHYPESMSLNAKAGGSMANGTYSYVLVYEQPESNGQISRSIVSRSSSITLTGSNATVDLVVPNLCVTSRYGDTGANASQPVSIVPYRTLSSTPSGPYYRVFPEGTNTSPSTSVGEAFVVTDTFADSTIATHPHVYTDGGIEDNAGPPCFLHVCVHKGRLWGIAEDGRTLWYSKQFVEGEAVSFVDDFTVFLEDSNGQAVGLASMDDKLVIFTRSRIYYLYGEGPTDAGTQGDYPSPIRLVTPVGCSDARSIVVTPAGIFFRSPVGIHLLTRGLEVQFVGQPVQDVLATYPVIRSAILHPTLPCVYFAVADADAPMSGARLVFDYRVGEWTVDKFPVLGGGVVITQGVRAGADVYFVSDGGAGLYREDQTTGLDAGQWVTMSVQTAHAKAAGMQGQQRVSLVTVLAERIEPHDLTVTAQGNYLGAPTQTLTITDDVLATQPFLPAEQVQLQVKTQTTEAMSVTVSDATPSGGAGAGTGKGAAFLGVTLELDMDKGTYRLGTAQKG